MNSVDYESAYYLSRYIQINLPGIHVHVPIRIILVAYLSAITIINYNHIAPTPKLQLNTDQIEMNPTLNFGIIEVDQIRRR